MTSRIPIVCAFTGARHLELVPGTRRKGLVSRPALGIDTILNPPVAESD